MDGKFSSGDVPTLDIKNIDTNFLYFNISRPNYWKSKESFSIGTGSKRIHEKTILNFDINVTNDFEEQRKISDIFNNLEKLITFNEKKDKYLDIIIKKLISEYTNKRLLFKKLNNTWNKRKLKDGFEILRGVGYSKNDVSKEGFEVLLYGQLYTNYKYQILNTNQFVSNKINNAMFSKKNDVVIPASGETSTEIARASSICKDGIILGSDLNIIRDSTKQTDGMFLALLLSNGKNHIKLSKISQGKTVVHLHRNDIESLEIEIQDYKTEKAFSSIIKSLYILKGEYESNFINLKELKKYLMQNMFV